METRANYVLVGACVLAAIATIVAFVFWLGRHQLRHEADTYYAYFTGSVSGLSAGSPVRYHGVPVGNVGTVEIDPENVERIRVTLNLAPHTPIKTDTVASLGLAGITGGSYVEMTGGTQASPPLTAPEGTVPVIKTVNSSLQLLVEDAPKLLGKFSQLADSANSALSADNVRAISETLAHLQNISASLDALTPQTTAAVKNLNQLIGDLHGQIPKLVESIQTDGASIKEAADQFRQVAGNINAVIAENRAPLRDFTGNGLTEITRLIAQLRELTDTLDRVAERLDRDPQRYLFGGGANGGVDPNRPIGTGAGRGIAR